MLGIRTQAVLVTRVTEGTAGTGDGDAAAGRIRLQPRVLRQQRLRDDPPVVPGPTKDLISFKLVTPLGEMPLYSLRKPAVGRTDVSFFDPYPG